MIGTKGVTCILLLLLGWVAAHSRPNICPHGPIFAFSRVAKPGLRAGSPRRDGLDRGSQSGAFDIFQKLGVVEIKTRLFKELCLHGRPRKPGERSWVGFKLEPRLISK